MGVEHITPELSSSEQHTLVSRGFCGPGICPQLSRVFVESLKQLLGTGVSSEGSSGARPTSTLTSQLLTALWLEAGSRRLGTLGGHVTGCPSPSVMWRTGHSKEGRNRWVYQVLFIFSLSSRWRGGHAQFPFSNVEFSGRGFANSDTNRGRACKSGETGRGVSFHQGRTLCVKHIRMFFT